MMDATEKYAFNGATLSLPNIYFKKISYSKNTYMIYENDQLTKLIKNTKNDTYLDGMTSDIVVNW